VGVDTIMPLDCNSRVGVKALWALQGWCDVVDTRSGSVLDAPVRVKAAAERCSTAIGPLLSVAL
jgi:hypothetical protein